MRPDFRSPRRVQQPLGGFFHSYICTLQSQDPSVFVPSSIQGEKGSAALAFKMPGSFSLSVKMLINWASSHVCCCTLLIIITIPKEQERNTQS